MASLNTLAVAHGATVADAPTGPTGVARKTESDAAATAAATASAQATSALASATAASSAATSALASATAASSAAATAQATANAANTAATAAQSTANTGVTNAATAQSAATSAATAAAAAQTTANTAVTNAAAAQATANTGVTNAAAAQGTANSAAAAAAAASSAATAAQAFAIQRGNHTGTQSADTVVDGTANKAFTAAEKTKLAGIAVGAPVTLTYASSLTPVLTDGGFRRCTMTGAGTLHPPTSPSDGARWECWFIASGADRVLTVDGAILVPSASTFTGAKTIASGKLCIVLLKYTGAAWMLVSLEGNF